MSDNQLKLSPLDQIHRDLGASFTPFGAWDMPLKYGNELDEHRAVRTAAGVFDLSHMGEIRVTGPDAGAFLDYALISTISSTKVGQAKYSMIVQADGGILDDLITYRLGENEFLVVPNASNTDVVWEAFTERQDDFDVTLANESDETALIAVQGPEAARIVSSLLSPEDAAALEELGYYRCLRAEVAGVDALIARTGYTGEDGFELFIPNADAVGLWRSVAEAGGEDLVPCGLASRDSLRLEAGMPLYGNELSREITPLEAGMARAWAKKEADFVGREALTGREQTVEIRGLVSDQKRAARSGSEVFLDGEKIGVVTSGQPAPTLGHPIALAHVTAGGEYDGREVEVDIRGKRYPFRFVSGAFYTRPGK